MREKVISRTATVVFFIGDAFFGNLTVYVPGAEAADFGFTSSLPAQCCAHGSRPAATARSARHRTASTGTNGGA